MTEASGPFVFPHNDASNSAEDTKNFVERSEPFLWRRWIMLCKEIIIINCDL